MLGKKFPWVFISAATVFLDVPAVGQGLLFSDSFSVQQGKRPTAWEAVAAPITPRFWYTQGGQLASGPGQDLGGDGYSFMIINSPGADNWTDYGISVDFWMRSRTGQVVLVGRYGDPGNHYEGIVWFSSRGQSAYIYRIRGGKREDLGFGVDGVGLDIPSVAAGSREQMQNLQFRMVGPTLGLYLNGKRLVDATDDAFRKGRAGLGVMRASAFFDNVRVERARIVGPTVDVRSGSVAGAGSRQVYRFLMGTFDTEAEARRFRGDLVVGGYINVTVEPADDKWDVLVGAFGSEDEALQERDYLESQNVAVPRIVVRTAGATQVFPVARRRAVAPDKAYTLLLSRVATKQEAGELRERLQLDGFFGAQIRPEAGGFVVALGSFRARADAERYQKLLEGVKYKVDRIIEEKPTEAPGPTVITPSEVSVAIRRSPVWETLTEDQRRQFQQIIQAGPGVTQDTTQYYMDLKNALDKVRLETRNEISKVIKEAEDRRSKEQRTAVLIASANNAVSAGNYAEARAALEKIVEIDFEPANTMVALIQQQIALRERSNEDSLAHQMTKLQRANLESQVAAAKLRAERFQAEGYFQNALMEFEGILDLVQRHNLAQPTAGELNQKIETLKKQILEGKTAIETRIRTVESGVKTVTGNVNDVASGQTSITRKQEEYKKYLWGMVGALAVLAAAIFFIFLGTRRRNRLLLEQMRSLTLKPMMEIAGGGGAAALGGGEKPMAALGGGAPAALGGPAEAPASSGAEAPGTEPSSLDIFTPAESDPLGGLGPAPEPEAPPEPPPEGKPEPTALFETPTPQPEEHSPFDVDDVEEEKKMPTVVEDPDSDVSLRLPEESPEPAPTVVDDSAEVDSLFSMLEGVEEERRQGASSVTADLHSAEGEQEQSTEVSISLGGEPPSTEQTVPASAEAPPQTDLSDLDGIGMEGAPDISDVVTPPPVEAETTPLDLDMIGVEMPEAESKPAPSASPGAYYEQPFDDEVVGSLPQGWEGGETEYDFASLRVSDETPAGGQGRYVRFEKSEGKGSAYYSCRFPDATGQVVIEFDLRCDQKNKFLLGFYVEKDGDFRQSIHTIVHQPDTAGAASLRVQGEAIPYEMGTWRHVKYVANLSTGRLSGYIDSETVINDIRLTNCPRSLNTLSIRDNIPTTGVLLIDNIKITRG